MDDEGTGRMIDWSDYVADLKCRRVEAIESGDALAFRAIVIQMSLSDHDIPGDVQALMDSVGDDNLLRHYMDNMEAVGDWG